MRMGLAKPHSLPVIACDKREAIAQGSVSDEARNQPPQITDLPTTPSNGRTTPKPEPTQPLKAAADESCRFHLQRQALWGDSQGSMCRGCCGCAPKAAATIHS